MGEFLKELWAFMKERKKFWLLPIIVMHVLLGSLIVLTQGSAVAPFIYTLFSAEHRKWLNDDRSWSVKIYDSSRGSGGFLCLLSLSMATSRESRCSDVSPGVDCRRSFRSVRAARDVCARRCLRSTHEVCER